MKGRQLAGAAIASAALILGGCATAPSDAQRMAPRCNSTPPLLVMATDPAQIIIKRGEPGFFPLRSPDEPMTMYRWLWLTFDRQTQVCLVSPLDYASAASRSQLEVGTVSAFGRSSAATASSIDHLGFDPQRQQAILAAAAAAGTKFVVVGRWIGGRSARYRLAESAGVEGSWFSAGSSVEATVVGALAQVEVQVFDAPLGKLVYRKLYSGLEESMLDSGSPPAVRIHAAAVRQAIASGVIEDLTRYMSRTGTPGEPEARLSGVALAADRPIVLRMRRTDAIAKLDVTLDEIQRSERYTRFDLRFHNLRRDTDAHVSLSRTALGLMSAAKSTSGQVYLSDDDSRRRTEQLTLRPGEAGTLSVVLRNDLGAMNDIALYVDADVRIGRAKGTRRVTFARVSAP